jgi:LCP family protein required for cell wall assembly
LAEKNTQDNQESSKKHKWLGILIIALLLLFIGLTGYYLESGLKPLTNENDNLAQIEEEQSLEEQSLIDSILSILGLGESDFDQDLNILFVGLDDEESVALGTIEADSIVLGKLRPNEKILQLEYIDENTNYRDKLLKKHNKEDIQLAVEAITKTEIDNYVYINYQGFEKVIDELGGIQLMLDEDVNVPGLGLDLKSGNNLLSGKEALNFVRWSSSEYLPRSERQKMLIRAVVAKLKTNNIMFNVKEIYNTIVVSYNSVETDINTVLAAEIFNYIHSNNELELEFID